ncbi:MAG: AAA family ATPase [Clostridia bacterium]|nr:AAA family ATPase [Clostridia bacterium]MDD4049345.1 AAA family ATPase [Clostridia bacterium]
MRITKFKVENFTCFENLELDFSNNINVFIGENSIGKTHILKSLYSLTKTIDNIYITEKKGGNSQLTKDQINKMLIDKFINVYRIDKIGRLVKRRQGRKKAELSVTIDNNKKFEMSFSNIASTKVEMSKDIRKLKGKTNNKTVYLPPKEIISASENFSALYDEYHIAFEETYADLCKLLLLPSKKGPNSDVQNQLLSKFEGVIDAKVVLKDNKFYLKRPGDGDYEMGLVAEGFRKFATILQLVQNGVLNDSSILFWDEPEANINPKLIGATVEMILLLATLGIQVFISTHSYFLVQELNMLSLKGKKSELNTKYFSFYRDADEIKWEEAANVEDLNHNVIMDEFLNLYNKEQEQFYDN